MAIRFNRVAGVSQYGTVSVEVPLHLMNESLGTVRLWLRELPAGLAKELEARVTEEDPLEALRQIAAWGVAGHEASDFLQQCDDETTVPILYKSVIGTYHNGEWPVAHPDTVSMYEHALPKGMFLYSIRAALSWYQIGIVPTPRQIWDSAKPKKEVIPLDEAHPAAPITLTT